MIAWRDGLLVEPVDLWLDSRKPRRLCFVSHAHTDHLGEHDHAIATPETVKLASRRISSDAYSIIPFGKTLEVFPGFSACLHSAGHVLGSAMLHLVAPDSSLLYTGDFKLRPGLTVPPARPVRADILICESTYGLPHFRFPPRQLVIEQLLELVHSAFRDGRQPILLGYSLGKAQEITRILTDSGINVTEHGAVANISDQYESLGVPLGKRRRYVADDFHGPAALDLPERGCLVAPPQVARTGFVDKFDNPLTIMLSGWGLLKNARFRYGVNEVLPLSDHADFDELLELVEIVRPKRVLTVHGYNEFAEHLRARGIDARPARPDAQLRLFD